MLRPGGRVVIVEPAITWLSTLFYRALHPKPVRMSAEVLLDGELDPRRNPYDSKRLRARTGPRELIISCGAQHAESVARLQKSAPALGSQRYLLRKAVNGR